MTEITFHPTRRGVVAHFSGDDCIGLSLARYGEWAEAELAMLRPYAPAGGVVLDIGANVGSHALGFAQMVGPQGRVIAVEGQPEVFELLAHNMVANGLAGRVRCVGALAGAAAARVPYAVGETGANAGARSFVAELAEPDGPERRPPGGEFALQLPVLTLDSLGLDACDLIKIDVEGLEPAVVRGALELIARFRPVIYFENNVGHEAALEPIAHALEPLGYRFFCHYANPFNRSNMHGATQNIFGGAVERNILALPPRGVEPDLPAFTIADGPPPPPPPEMTVAGVAL